MQDYSNIKFPVTLAEFTRIQREALHRNPTADEREIYREIVDLANEAYNAAAAGDSNTVADILNAINCSAAETPAAGQVAAVSRSWVLIATKAGMDILREKTAN